MSSEVIKSLGYAAKDTEENIHEVTTLVQFARKRNCRGEKNAEVDAWLASIEGSEEIATEHAGYIIKVIKCQFISHHLNGATPGTGPAKVSCLCLKNL